MKNEQIENGHLMCIGCRHLDLARDFKVSGRGICRKTGELLEMPMIACDAYEHPDHKHIPIPDWYREILTPTQANYMQELFDGRSIHRIAEIYDRTDQSVSVTIRRAKTRIREYRESMPGYVDTDSISSYPELKSAVNSMYGITAEEAINNGALEKTSDQ